MKTDLYSELMFEEGGYKTLTFVSPRRICNDEGGITLPIFIVRLVSTVLRIVLTFTRGGPLYMKNISLLF